MANKRAEYELCKALSTYIKLQYPNVEYRWDLTGLGLSMVQAKMNKAIQKNRGYPDLEIFEKRHGYGMLLIEAKAETIYKKDGITLLAHKKTIKNSKGVIIETYDHHLEQKEKLELLERKGYKACFGMGFDQCKQIIDDYLK